MNDTKWDEIRLAMYNLGPMPPRWRTRDRLSGHVSDWDREWFYHFRSGGYDSVEWLEIAIDGQEQREAVRAALRRIHVPGEETATGFLVHGFAEAGRSVDYL